MIHKSSALAVLFAGIGLAWQLARADDLVPVRHARPVCEPGYKILAEIVYKDVVKIVCRTVPKVKTKWVYAVVDDPICVLHSAPGCQCSGCEQIYRKVLVKKLVDEPYPAMKCISEKIVDRIPYTVYHKVPCDSPSAVCLPTMPAKK